MAAGNSIASAVVLFIGCCGLLAQGETASPVKVTTYYESLCPDSVRFFKRQLEPTYNQVGDIMNVELHAYGKASDKPRVSGDGYTFKCQHGPDECYGNQMLECGQKYITDHEAYLNFAFCVMAADYPPSSGQACASEVGWSFDAILRCSNSTEGESLLHEAGLVQAQLDPALSYVPWILIDDEYSDENLNAAQKDLTSLVCSTYTGDLPQECL